MVTKNTESTNTMNLHISTKIASTYLFTLMLMGCESHIQKADDDFEQVKLEKSKPQKAVAATTELKHEVLPKPEADKKTEPVMDEWTRFKTDIEKKIISNEAKIKEIKSAPKPDSKLLKKALSLEEDNNALRKNMNDYNEEVKTKWETFKATTVHSVNEIEIELKDLAKDTKK